MANKLSARDLQEYHKGMFDLNDILGATKIKYYPLNLEESKPNIYGENKRPKYLDPLYLTGLVKFPNYEKEPLLQGSSKQDITVTVEITLLGFTKYSYVDSTKEPVEKPTLDPYSIIKGYFILEGKKYTIDECLPQGLFADTYTSYLYLCRGVDII